MSNDTWATPKPVFEYYNSRYDFACDVAASDENHLCDKYITEDEDCLSSNWNGFGLESGDYVWCNPPYSKPLPFVQKCIDESICLGIGSVILVNHDMSVGWSALLTSIGCNIEVFTASGDKSEKTYRTGRIAFIDTDGYPVPSNPKGQVAVIIPPFVDIYREPQTIYVPLSVVMDEGQRMIDEKFSFSRKPAELEQAA